MAIEHDLESPLARAVRAAGSQSAFGRVIGRSQSYVHKLLSKGRELTAREAILVDDSPIGVTKEELLPDIFKPIRGVTHVDTPERGTRHHFTTATERAR